MVGLDDLRESFPTLMILQFYKINFLFYFSHRIMYRLTGCAHLNLIFSSLNLYISFSFGKYYKFAVNWDLCSRTANK